MVAGRDQTGILRCTAFEQPIGLTLLHMFNHGTHHRGQISAAVSGFGYDVPAMDLIRYLREIYAETT